ncbi:DoxX family membrane protein [Rhodococcus erythropolis]|uniref:MauE/DoxX family redox-associated membrane protein n=1 Tax=Rhodococcus erythropolis TaxID=1833 RepID=UPI001E2BB5E5|nr:MULTISPECIES: MauE/DoxX family redox-associated membrane protein [Rhodococcus erythropolis group]MCD2109078.1 DoxX family membrane protein [Rhodococcus qingshengii]MCZ4528004.1 DoxX family membrane protein [Rhodococcus erythropolis]
MDLVSATTSAIIGFVLLLAGIPKLNDHNGVLSSVRGYKVLPTPLEVPIARALPVAESVVGVLLVLGVAHRLAALVAAFMFASFFTGVTINLLRGRRDLDCGCFAFGAGKIPHIGWFHAVRAGTLAAISVAVSVAPNHAEIGVQVPAASFAFLLVLAGVALAQIRSVVHLGRRPVDDYLSSASIRLRTAETASRYGS